MAQHAAMGLSSIADAVSAPPESEILRPYYHDLLQKLMDCAEKTGAANNQLRENAAYGLISVIGCKVTNTDSILENFSQFVTMKCQQALVRAGGSGDA